MNNVFKTGTKNGEALLNSENSGYSAFNTADDKKLMKLFLDCPDYVRRVIITDNQIDLIYTIKEVFCNAMTARNLANHRGISIQAASTMLSNLWRTGYVVRNTIPDETGGIKHVYKTVDLNCLG